MDISLSPEPCMQVVDTDLAVPLLCTYIFELLVGDDCGEGILREEAREQGTPDPGLGYWSGEGKREIENCGWDGDSVIVGSSYAPTACTRGGGRKWRRTNRGGTTRTLEAWNAGRRTSKHTGRGKGVE